MKRMILAALVIAMIAACKSKTTNVAEPVKSQHAQTKDMFPEPKVKIKTVGILLYDNYAVLDAMGPYHVLSELMGAKVFFVGRHKGLITTGNGMKIQCDTSINEVKQLDILVIPGGLNETYSATKDTVLLNWIKAIDVHSKYTTSVCTGAWILAATGLLKDRQATTHWYGKQILKDKFHINPEDNRYVQSGKYWTSAGVSAGIDMSLGLINDIMGEKYTKTVMLDLEYDPQPPVKGGGEHNTDKEIVESVRSMYDSALEPLLNPKSVSTKTKIDNDKDPVCGMALTGYVDTVHYKEKIIGFCSARCKNGFRKIQPLTNFTRTDLQGPKIKNKKKRKIMKNLRNVTLTGIFAMLYIISVHAQNKTLTKPIDAVIDNYLAVKNALTNADGTAAETKAKALLAAINEVPKTGLSKDEIALFNKLEFDSRHISEVNLVTHQREHFASLSKNMFTALKDLKLNQKNLFWQYCTMRSNYFISETATGKDPYMGMTNCSKVKETLPAVK
jgi:putative intracellular protease/amidase/YHS domain-containing protein